LRPHPLDILTRIDSGIAALRDDGLAPFEIRLSPADMEALGHAMDEITPEGPRFAQTRRLGFWYAGAEVVEGGDASVMLAKSPGPRRVERQAI
jgi:hypothetical protein